MNTLIIRKTGPHAIVHLNDGSTVTETSIEHLAEPFIQSTMGTQPGPDLVVFDGCTWAHVSGDVYTFLSKHVPSKATAVCVPHINGRSVL